MNIRSQLSPSRACSACHTKLLRSFIYSVTASFPVLTTIRRSFATSRETCGAGKRLNHLKSSRNCISLRSCAINATYLTNRTALHRTSLSCFATATARYQNIRQDDQLAEDREDAALLDAQEEDELSLISDNQDDPDYVPWYLRDKSPSSSTAQHTLPGQDMPELPEHSPELLQPIVSHVVEKLGLTFVEILDLRTVLNPPPALGSNLLMVTATARSERHLHASADKFCRWLRSEYRLTPYADGLLGRNEMKIAVRRRVRRAKMMSAVGAGGGSEGDIADGIRSGWICVHVGRVEGGVLPETVAKQGQQDIVGFGTTSTMSTVVVQMMTEEKREELKLEELWRETKRRQDNKRSALAIDEADPEIAPEIDDTWSNSIPQTPPTQLKFGGTYTPRIASSTARRHTPTF